MGEDSRLRAVVELTQAMAAAQGLTGAVRAAAHGACAAMDASFAAVSVWERERGRLRVLVNAGELAGDEEEFPADESYPVSQFPEIAGFLREHRPGGAPRAWVETVEDPPGGPGAGTRTGTGGHHQRAAALRRRGRGSCVVAPLVLHGRAWGELYVARAAGAPAFGRPDADFGSVLAAVAAAGLIQLERLEEARRLAFTDPLTGLANRRAVDARLEEAIADHRRRGTAVSLVVCDINGLKAVNDSYGHVAGDRLLERFGSVLSLCGARLPGALAARLGGDEFCLVAAGPSGEEVVAAAREVCRRAAGLELGGGVACGVATTGGHLGPVRSARRLFRLADAAQYRAKSAGAREPVIAGHQGPDDEVVRLADATPPDGDRRALRGRQWRPTHRTRR